MSRRPTRGLPADLPPAVARHQASWGRAAGVSVAMLVVCGLYVGGQALTGDDLSGAFTDLAPWLGLCALLFLWKVRRRVLAAGPGWLSSREYVKTSWVRTDRLVRLSWGMAGIDPVLTLVDDEDRRVSVTRSVLGEDVRLTLQVTDDVRRSLARGLKADKRALAVLYIDEEVLP